jgi:hypothetical protein
MAIAGVMCPPDPPPQNAMWNGFVTFAN